jgi:hypothetical protein
MVKFRTEEKSLAEYSKKGYGTKRAVLPTVTMVMMVVVAVMVVVMTYTRLFQ